jgi:hypothetical protein
VKEPEQRSHIFYRAIISHEEICASRTKNCNLAHALSQYPSPDSLRMDQYEAAALYDQD